MQIGDSYELLDFGLGRKLERFGARRVDRPAPAAAGHRCANPAIWSTAEARFERTADRAAWSCAPPVEEPWLLPLDNLQVELKPTDFGHLGLFPEQADNWRWIAAQVRRAGAVKLLNLFAYTGASTLVAAAAGAEVVHVDAAANVVAWARRNAAHSQLQQAPIRWIVEDAPAFVRRELKRGNRYDAVLLDPPAYGHGPRGQGWKLQRHLDELLAQCFELCAGNERFMLLSCHSGSLASAAGLLDYARRHPLAAQSELPCRAVRMELVTQDGRRLPAGAAVRWSRLD